jgi:hypothetical protein
MAPPGSADLPIVALGRAQGLLVPRMLTCRVQTVTRSAPGWLTLLLLAVGGVTATAWAGAAGPEAMSVSYRPGTTALVGSGHQDVTCPLCQPRGVRLVRLSEAQAAAQGRGLSNWNQRQLARVDSLYQSGNFGAPGSGESIRAAHLMARLVTRNAYEALLRLAADSTTVYEASESTLAGPFASYSDPSLFPVTRLVRARFGMGRVCLQYDLSGKLDTLVALGEKHMRVRLEDTDIEHVRRRVLCMQLPIGADEMVEVLVAEHFTCEVQRSSTDGPPAPAIIDQLGDMQGFWVRKWGIHRPRALVFWVTPRADTLATLPTIPLVGVRLYVPNLVLSLPFLPDVGFDDLRELDLPQPILALDALRGGQHPVWLRPAEPLGFAGWTCWGPVPAAVRGRFPDL